MLHDLDLRRAERPLEVLDHLATVVGVDQAERKEGAALRVRRARHALLRQVRRKQRVSLGQVALWDATDKHRARVCAG